MAYVTEKTREQHEKNYTGDTPVAIYKKTSRGKVEVEAMDLDMGIIKNVILEGIPGTPDSFIKLYSDYEAIFFSKSKKNIWHLNNEKIELTKEVPVLEVVQEYSDEYLALEVGKHFKTVEKFLREEIVTEELALRMVQISEKEEATSGIIKMIQGHLSMFQGGAKEK